MPAGSAMCRSDLHNPLCQACVVVQTFHGDPDHPDPRPPPALTLTLTLNPTLTLTLRGARGRQGQSRGSAEVFGGDSLHKRRAAESPAWTNKTRIPHKVLCRPLMHMRRVCKGGRTRYLAHGRSRMTRGRGGSRDMLINM